jgi:hypothetical protein
MSAGSIVIDLLLKTSSFSTDAARSAKDLKKLQQQAYDTGRALGDSLRNIAAAAGVTLSVAAFTNLIKGSIDAADHLNDLSKKTGIAVETLGGIGFAAQQSGSDLESASAAAGKLNKSLAEAAAGNALAGEAFKVLGINVKDATGATKSADAVFAEIADKFASYTDGPEKAALAIRIFGKAGADIIPLLDEGGRKLQENIGYYKLYSGVTQQTAERADEFRDTLDKLGLLQGAFTRNVASELLPSLQAVANAFLRAKEKGDGFKATAEFIKDTFDNLVIGSAIVALSYANVGREITGVVDKLTLLNKAAKDNRSLLDPFGAGAFVKSFDSEEYKALDERLKKGRQSIRDEFTQFVRDITTAGGKTLTTGDFARADRTGNEKKKPAPSLTDSSAADKAQAELKKRLDGQIKLIQQFADDQKQGYEFANRFLDSVYADGLVSLTDFFASEQRVRDAALAAQLAGLDKQIAAEQKALPKLTGTNRIEVEDKITEAVQKRAAAVEKAGQDQVLVERANARALEQTQDRYNDLRATILEGQGDIAAGAALRIDQQVRDAARLIQQAGGNAADADTFRGQLQSKAALSKAQEDFNLLAARSGDLEESFLLRSQAAGASLQDIEQGVYSIRAASLVQLGELRDRIQAIAAASSDPRVQQAALDIGVAYEKAAQQVDPAINRLREGIGSLSDSISNDIGSAILDFKSLGDVANSVLKDIEGFVIKIAITDPLKQSIQGALQGLSGPAGCWAGW